MLNINTYVDYSGQKLAEKIYQRILIVFAVIGFLVGYVSEHLSYSIYILGLGCFIAAVVTLPPWPFYRRDSIKWLKSNKDVPTNKSSKKRH